MEFHRTLQTICNGDVETFEMVLCVTKTTRRENPKEKILNEIHIVALCLFEIELIFPISP